jgi:hypothetical protein
MNFDDMSARAESAEKEREQSARLQMTVDSVSASEPETAK